MAYSIIGIAIQVGIVIAGVVMEGMIIGGIVSILSTQRHIQGLKVGVAYRLPHAQQLGEGGLGVINGQPLPAPPQHYLGFGGGRLVG